MDAPDPKEAVRRGCDALSHRYGQPFGADTEYGPWTADLLGRPPERAEEFVPEGAGGHALFRAARP